MKWVKYCKSDLVLQSACAQFHWWTTNTTQKVRKKGKKNSLFWTSDLCKHLGALLSEYRF